MSEYLVAYRPGAARYSSGFQTNRVGTGIKPGIGGAMWDAFMLGYTATTGMLMEWMFGGEGFPFTGFPVRSKRSADDQLPTDIGIERQPIRPREIFEDAADNRIAGGENYTYDYIEGMGTILLPDGWSKSYDWNHNWPNAVMCGYGDYYRDFPTGIGSSGPYGAGSPACSVHPGHSPPVSGDNDYVIFSTDFLNSTNGTWARWKYSYFDYSAVDYPTVVQPKMYYFDPAIDDRMFEYPTEIVDAWSEPIEQPSLGRRHVVGWPFSFGLPRLSPTDVFAESSTKEPAKPIGRTDSVAQALAKPIEGTVVTTVGLGGIVTVPYPDTWGFPTNKFPHPPGPKTKERKIKKGPVMGKINFMIGQVTEIRDFVQALWEALPKKYRPKRVGPKGGRRKPTLLEMMGDIWNARDYVMSSEQWVHDAMINAITNEIIDNIYGTAGQQYRKAYQRLLDSGEYAGGAGLQAGSRYRPNISNIKGADGKPLAKGDNSLNSWIKAGVTRAVDLVW